MQMELVVWILRYENPWTQIQTWTQILFGSIQWTQPGLKPWTGTKSWTIFNFSVRVLLVFEYLLPLSSLPRAWSQCKTVCDFINVRESKSVLNFSLVGCLNFGIRLQRQQLKRPLIFSLLRGEKRSLQNKSNHVFLKRLPKKKKHRESQAR